MSRESSTLGRLLPLAATLAPAMFACVFCGCFSPVFPGCGPHRENAPDGESALITVYIGSETQGVSRGSFVSVDQSGRSELVGDHTVWLFSFPVVCKTVAQRDVLRIRDAWESVARDGSVTARGKAEARPYLAISFSPGETSATEGGDAVSYVVRPNHLETGSDFENALSLTLDVLIDLYGDRLVREIRYAGLESLLPVENPND